MEPPSDHEFKWCFQRIFVSATRFIRENESLKPYLQGRLGVVRLHPSSELFAMDPLPEGGEGRSHRRRPGGEWQMTRTLALDASLILDYWHVGETDLSPMRGACGRRGAG